MEEKSSTMRMLELAYEIEALDEEKKSKEAELKEIEQKRQQAEAALIALMKATNTSSIPTEEREYFRETNTTYKVNEEKKEFLYRELREKKCGRLIKETINYQTLGTFIRGRKEDNKGQIPKWITDLIRFGCINANSKETIKSRKKK